MSYDVDIADESFNYTWNMSEFFTRFGVHPYRDLAGRYAGVAADEITLALGVIATYDESVLRERYHADNGWGDVPTATDWLRCIRDACERHPDEILKAT